MRMPRDHLEAISHQYGLVGEARRFLPVYRLVVALVGDDFGSQIIGSATERPCLVWDTLGETKVGNLEMPMTIK